MNKNILRSAFFAFLFVFATSARAQNCSTPNQTSLFNYYQNPPGVTGPINFPDADPCPGTQTTVPYTVTAQQSDWCTNTNNGSTYASSNRTIFGNGLAYCEISIFKSLDTLCNPQFYYSSTTATYSTDYNTFTLEAYDNQPGIGGGCFYILSSSSRTDTWSCHGVLCNSGPPDCSCCSGPLGAKLLETPQQKDVKFRGKPQTGCYYDCPCCPAACSPQSPIVLDVTGAGFFLTDAAHGVLFDLRGAGNPIQIAWTAANANNAFLALPGADGLVHNGQQLFGNFTRQPPSDNPNGFAALAVYDLPANGGNGDGIIDSRDAVFSSLRLWIDANHDGISQPNELFTLPSLGVTSISLNYKWDQRTDQFGNVFRYRAQVNPGDPTNTGRVAYDVFFSILTSGGSITTAKCEVPGTKGLLATGKGLSKK